MIVVILVGIILIIAFYMAYKCGYAHGQRDEYRDGK